MDKSLIFVWVFLLSPFFASSQSAQATMEIKVKVTSGISNELLEVMIRIPDHGVGKDFDYQIFPAKTKELNEKEGILLYKVNDRPNKNMLLSFNTIQKFKNSSGKEVIFIIHSVGYSYTPDKDSIKYFDNIECNKFRTDAEGKVYIWVDGHFFFSESMEGEFRKTIKFKGPECQNI